MKKMALVLLAGLLIAGCAKKEEIKTINWQKFQDPYTRIAFSHPANWFIQQEGSKVTFYSTTDAVVKFNPYSIEGKDAARIVVSVQKDSIGSQERNVRSFSEDLNASGFEVDQPVIKNIADVPGSLVHYRGALDAKNIIEGSEVIALRDSMLYTVRYEGFNKTYAGYKMVLDTVLASLHLPAPKVVEKDVDPSIPSAETELFENDMIKISYPANFSVSTPAAKAPVQFSLMLMGYRKDCSIQVDVLPAKGLSAEKVIDQNAKFFKVSSRGKSKIDGVETTYLNYSPMKDIQSRAYFLVKNDKIHRIIINYYTPMKSTFLPVFEKTVASIVVK